MGGRLGLRPDSVSQKLKWIEKRCWENFTVAYIRQNKEQDLGDVMGAYDFIALTVRFEESLLIAQFSFRATAGSSLTALQPAVRHRVSGQAVRAHAALGKPVR